MIIRKPDYYDRFHCIAGACSDSCCIGWEIDVDEERREQYRKETGEIGQRLHAFIDWEEGHFILQGKEERCPFLNEDNLCDLILELGEESLCEICREHPRYYEWYDGLTEVGVGLCCEEAARLILENENKAYFVECEEPDDEPVLESDTEEAQITQALMHARETAFLILQNRTYSVWQRMSVFLSYVDELQDALDFGNPDEIKESAEYYRNMVPEISSESGRDWITVYKKVLDYCERLEPIDEKWPVRMKKLRTLLEMPDVFGKAERNMQTDLQERDYEYEHLAVYFVYRYFMKSREDGDIYSRGCLTVFCILLICLLDIAKYLETGSLSKVKRAHNSKDCSKEIEYSEENLALLAEMFWEDGFEKIAGCL